MRSVLNVGGGSKDIALPAQFDGWEHVLLDIKPRNDVDIVCDARELLSLSAYTYDAVYCSHNLEHYYAHDVGKVLAGFAHVLKQDGFAYIRVPDMGDVLRTIVDKGMDINDVLYQSAAGPITAHDVIYGYGKEIAQSGNDFYAHKTGFTGKSLLGALEQAGFSMAFVGSGEFEIKALAFIGTPSAYASELFNLPSQG